MKNLPAEIPQRTFLPKRYEEQDELSQVLSVFESETAGVLAETSPRNERVILYTMAIMLVLAVVLSAVVKLDRVVSGRGEVLSVGGPLYVSPLNIGVVREVRVKAGDMVKKGQVLATLDPTLTQADVAQLRQKVDSDRAALDRLMAEHSDQPFTPAGDNPNHELQLSIWNQRRAEYQSNLANLDAQVLNARAVVSQYSRDVEQYQKRLKLAQEREKMFDPLSKKGYVSQLQLNALQDAREEAERFYSQSQSQLAAARQKEASARAQKTAYVEKWHADVGAQIVATRSTLETASQELEKAEKMLELGTLVAPADAIVLKIGKVSTGAVAGATADLQNPQLFTLAPLDAPLEAEINVNSQYIGFIRPGDEVTLKLDAFSFIRHGTARGTIKSISEGSFTLDENNQPTAPYFKVRVAITNATLRDVPEDFRLIPGMTIAGDVMVGERTILSYLLEGALRTGSEAMREVQ